METYNETIVKLEDVYTDIDRIELEDRMYFVGCYHNEVSILDKDLNEVSRYATNPLSLIKALYDGNLLEIGEDGCRVIHFKELKNGKFGAHPLNYPFTEKMRIEKIINITDRHSNTFLLYGPVVIYGSYEAGVLKMSYPMPNIVHNIINAFPIADGVIGCLSRSKKHILYNTVNFQDPNHARVKEIETAPSESFKRSLISYETDTDPYAFFHEDSVVFFRDNHIHYEEDGLLRTKRLDRKITQANSYAYNDKITILYGDGHFYVIKNGFCVYYLGYLDISGKIVSIGSKLLILGSKGMALLSLEIEKNKIDVIEFFKRFPYTDTVYNGEFNLGDKRYEIVTALDQTNANEIKFFYKSSKIGLVSTDKTTFVVNEKIFIDDTMKWAGYDQDGELYFKSEGITYYLMDGKLVPRICSFGGEEVKLESITPYDELRANLNIHDPPQSEKDKIQRFLLSEMKKHPRADTTRDPDFPDFTFYNLEVAILPDSNEILAYDKTTFELSMVNGNTVTFNTKQQDYILMDDKICQYDQSSYLNYYYVTQVTFNNFPEKFLQGEITHRAKPTVDSTYVEPECFPNFNTDNPIFENDRFVIYEYTEGISTHLILCKKFKVEAEDKCKIVYLNYKKFKTKDLKKNTRLITEKINDSRFVVYLETPINDRVVHVIDIVNYKLSTAFSHQVDAQIFNIKFSGEYLTVVYGKSIVFYALLKEGMFKRHEVLLNTICKDGILYSGRKTYLIDKYHIYDVNYRDGTVERVDCVEELLPNLNWVGEILKFTLGFIGSGKIDEETGKLIKRIANKTGLVNVRYSNRNLYVFYTDGSIGKINRKISQ